MTPEILKMLDPAWVVPLVAVLVDKDCQENGSIFEVGGGHIAKYRWQRSRGAVLKCGGASTTGELVQKWSEVDDFREAEHPDSPFSLSDLNDRLRTVQENHNTDELYFTSKVVLVTGGGVG